MGELQFIEDGHQYIHDGRTIPGITQAIREAGLSGRMPDPWYLKRGSAVHLACAYLSKGRLNWDTVDPRIRPYVEAFRKFMDTERFKVRLIEEMAHSDIYNFACRVDWEGTFERSHAVEDIVLELKTGGPDPWHGYQLAGQTICLPLLKRGMYRRYGLELKENGNYRLHPYTDRQDGTIALACVTLWHVKNNQGRLRYGIGATSTA